MLLSVERKGGLNLNLQVQLKVHLVNYKQRKSKCSFVMSLNAVLAMRIASSMHAYSNYV